MNTFQPVMLALIRKGESYLLTLRVDDNSLFNGKWQIPGGALEFGETPEEGLRREVREELGIEIDIVKLIPFIDISVRGNWQGLFITYLCTLHDDLSEIFLNEEASEYRWLTRKEMEKLPLLKGCIELIDEAEKIV
jgi:mutator protein MutT